MDTTTIVVANSKGGVGKSATAAFLCSEASARRIPTLAVDLDPQGSLTRYLYSDTCTGEAFAAALESEEVCEQEVAVQTSFPFVDILPAGPQLDARIELQHLPHVEVRLKTLFQDLGYAGRYPLIVVDTRPSLGRLTLNAFNLPNARVVVPVRDDDNSIDGLRGTLAALRQVRRLSNDSVSCVGILRTMVRGRGTRLQRRADDWLQQTYQELLLEHSIPDSQPLRQAMVGRESIRRFVSGAIIQERLDTLFLDLMRRAGFASTSLLSDQTMMEGATVTSPEVEEVAPVG